MVEVIMAILILMVGMLGLLQAINLASEVNLRNQIREEGVFMAERVMNEMRGRGFDNISVASTPTQPFNYGPYQLPSKIRGVSRTYTVQKSSSVLSTVNSQYVTKQLSVTVSWSYKGVGYQNKVVAPISILR
jgi:type IV pilus assembly protein PilV